MKYLFRWLLPILTILAVLTAVLLPQQLSLFRDQSLFSVIHTEELKIESTISTQESERNLTQQIELLVEFYGYEDDFSLTIINRSFNKAESTPEERQEMTELLFLELEMLKENRVILEQYFTQPVISGEWFYLQRPKEDTGSWFLSIELYEQDKQGLDYALWMILDKESGTLLALSLMVPKWDLTKTEKEIGTFFLDQIGLDYKLMEEKDKVIFSLTGTDLAFQVIREDNVLQFFPRVLSDKGVHNFSDFYGNTNSMSSSFPDKGVHSFSDSYGNSNKDYPYDSDK